MTATMQQHDVIRNAAKVRSTTRRHNKISEKVMNVIRDSVSNLAISDDEVISEEAQQAQADTQFGNLSKEDKCGWLLGTIPQMVKHRKQSFHCHQMRLDDLNQKKWGGASEDTLCEQYEVQDGRFDGFGSCEGPKSDNGSNSITDNISRACADS
jgi:hypothetical protein